MNESSENISYKISNNIDTYVDFIDIPGVMEAFIIVYVILWIFCVTGNVIVLLVMRRSKIVPACTNLFLKHLAVADLSVGIVCIIPNLVLAKTIFWLSGPLSFLMQLGLALCKLYNFFEEFCMTASVLLLVLIAVERYTAILYPFQARFHFTKGRMVGTLVLVWLLACIHTLPLCFLYHTTTIYLDNHTSPLTFCYRNDDDRSSPINMRVYSMVSFVFTYLAPLSIMIVMYLRVSMTLWNSRASVHMRTEVVGSKRITGCLNDSITCRKGSRRWLLKHDGNPASLPQQKDNHGPHLPLSQTSILVASHTRIVPGIHLIKSGHTRVSSLRLRVDSDTRLRERRKVVRLLVLVLITFAMCVLPFHLRSVLRYYSNPGFLLNEPGKYITQVMFFLNSALNPVLYSFLSKSFRRNVRQVFCRSFANGRYS